MTRTDRVLCSLESDFVGEPPSRFRVEARARPQGFSIWLWDEHAFPAGAEIGATTDAYHWRTFAAILAENRSDSGICKIGRGSLYLGLDEQKRSIVVAGERGLRAQVLRCAITGDSGGFPRRFPSRWLQRQSDAALDALEAIVGATPSLRWYLLDEIGDAASLLEPEPDLFALLRRYGITRDLDLCALHELRDHLVRADQQERDFLARERLVGYWKHEGRYPGLAPFEDGMRALMADWDLLNPIWGTTAERMAKEARRSRVRRCVEDYVLEHRRLPTGSHRIPSRWNEGPPPSRLDERNSSLLDFDWLVAMAATVRTLRPQKHLLWDDELVLFFWQPIEAIVSQISIEPVRSINGRDVKSKRDWLCDFLWAYVKAYERLPRGKLRVDFSQLEPYRATVDLGEIDFDQFGELVSVTPDDCPTKDHERKDRNREVRFVAHFDQRYARLERQARVIDGDWCALGGESRYRSCLKWYVQDHVIAHGRLPTGRQPIPLYRWDGLVDDRHGQSFEVDFDTLAERAAQAREQYGRRHTGYDFEPLIYPGPLGRRYFSQLGDRELMTFFRSHIDAIAAQVGEDHLSSAQGWFWPRRRWMTLYLELFVMGYERIPRGRLRVDFTHLLVNKCEPTDCPDWAADLGEIDFDALREGAGVPAAAAESLYVRMHSPVKAVSSFFPRDEWMQAVRAEAEEAHRKIPDPQRRERLAPFADQIALMVCALGCSLNTSLELPPDVLPGGKIESLTRTLESYALEHGRLPTGRITLPAQVNPAFGSDEFDVDLDALATKVDDARSEMTLPRSYRLPRHERAAFFRPMIDAMLLKFDEAPHPDPVSHRSRRLWLKTFLADYATEYERLPHGRMKVNSDRIPLRFIDYYLGEVDFDALRKTAGVPDDDEAVLHSRDESAS